MKLIPACLSLLIVFTLPSCIDTYSGYGGGGYGGGFDNVGYSTPYYRGNNNYPGYYGGGGYYNNRSNSANCDHDDHNHSTKKNTKDRNDEIRLVRGNDGDHSTRPTGYHSKEWYKERGYDLHKYTYKDEDGDVKHKAHSSNKKH